MAALYLKPKIVKKEEDKEPIQGFDMKEKMGGRRPEAASTPPPVRTLEWKPTEDINDSAEAFIKKFRQQLLLQRLESIENYNQMLQRGT